MQQKSHIGMVSSKSTEKTTEGKMNSFILGKKVYGHNTTLAPSVDKQILNEVLLRAINLQLKIGEANFLEFQSPRCPPT